MMDSSAGFDRRIAERVRAARKAAGLTIEALAQRSGVSRAMISKIERAETSPTAALLARLSVGLQVTIGALLAEPERGALSRAGDGLPWRDPASGYLRRQVSPAGTGSPVEIVEVTFPPGGASRSRPGRGAWSISTSGCSTDAWNSPSATWSTISAPATACTCGSARRSSTATARARRCATP